MKKKLLIIAALTTVFMAGCSSSSSSHSSYGNSSGYSSSSSNSSSSSSKSSDSSSSSYLSNIDISNETVEYYSSSYSQYNATVTNNNNVSLKVIYYVYAYDANGVKLDDGYISETIPANTSAYVETFIESSIDNISSYEVVGLEVR